MKKLYNRIVIVYIGIIVLIFTYLFFTKIVVNDSYQMTYVNDTFESNLSSKNALSNILLNSTKTIELQNDIKMISLTYNTVNKGNIINHAIIVKRIIPKEGLSYEVLFEKQPLSTSDLKETFNPTVILRHRKSVYSMIVQSILKPFKR